MTIERPEQWAIDRLHEERGLWALDVARGVWLKVWDHQEEYALRGEDFVFCGYVEAARIYAGGLVPVGVDKQRGIVDKCQQGRVA